MRWLLLALVALLVFGQMAFGATGLVIRGALGATDQEAQEGYFAVGPDFMLVAKPGSDHQEALKQMLGRNVVVVVEAR